MATASSEVRNWAILCHLGALAILLGIPLGNILVPLIIWLIKRDEDPFIDEQGREALNFQITISILCTVIGVSVFFFMFLIPALAFLAGLALFALWAVDLVLVIMGAMESSKGRHYRYPSNITMRFL